MRLTPREEAGRAGRKKDKCLSLSRKTLVLYLSLITF